MSKQYVSTNGIVKIPGAYSAYTIETSVSGLATSGVLMLMGEAVGGPNWSAEDELSNNAFGPDSLTEVVAKYQSGPLVDAFRGAVNASNDPNIVGSFNRAILVKTNTSTKASANLLTLGSGTAYATILDRNFGSNGNQIQMAVASAVAETVPATGTFTYIPAVGIVGIDTRVNGAAAVVSSITANSTPAAFTSTMNGVAGLAAVGGANRNVLTVSGTLAVAVVSGNAITVTRSVNWAVTPTAGDTMVIPTGSPIVGAGNANIGAYVITGATATTISATKLSDAGRAGAVAGTITAPVAVTAVAAAAVTDVSAWSPVAISNSSTVVIPGAGKSLELAEVAGADLLSRMAYVVGTTTPVSWVSKSSLPALITSATESKAGITLARSLDNSNESYAIGGEISLRVGYTGSAVTMTINATQLVTTGGALPLTLNLSSFATIQALSDFLNTQAGYHSSVGTATLGFLPPTALDRVTSIGISSEYGTVDPGRVKIDAYRVFTALQASGLVQMGNPTARANAGLPAVTSTTFFSGGTTGGTTNAAVSAALTGLEGVDGNFLIPLFSRDASSDIVDGKTDIASTYTIAAINAAARAHVLALSTYKRRQPRQALNSIQDTFQAQQDAAANTASFRVNMLFQNVSDVDSTGNLVVFPPWMAAVKAASMQAAGFYRSVENKKVAINGLSHAAGDYKAKNQSNVEDALTAGLMPLRPSRTGGFEWVSDQTTYGTDSNFVLNSLQAVYAADTVSQTASIRMEQAFVGQSVADVSAQIALTYLDQIMAEFLRLKLIAPSDSAKKGYKNASIKISGNVMLVQAQIFLAGAIDFIDIQFKVSQVEQTA